MSEIMLKNPRFKRIKIYPTSTGIGRINIHKVDATTEAEIEAQIIEDEKEADAEILKKRLYSNSIKVNK
jgi:hypothetical protein